MDIIPDGTGRNLAVVDQITFDVWSESNRQAARAIFIPTR